VSNPLRKALSSATGRLRSRLLPSLTQLTQRASGGRHVFVTSYPTETAPLWEGSPNSALSRLLEPGIHRFERARQSIEPHLGFLADIPVDGSTAELHWDNGFWGALDAGFQCASLIERRPAQYVEVGSGYSTMFARLTIEKHQIETTITSIDPEPRAEIDVLCDRVVRSPLQHVDPALFHSLVAGDVVVFDGSHEAYMGADSVVMLLEILPMLAPGVLIGIDDIFLPWDYPAEWKERFYAEQYLLASYLLGLGNADSVVLPAYFLSRTGPKKHPFDALVPHLGSFGKSFWLERT